MYNVIMYRLYTITGVIGVYFFMCVLWNTDTILWIPNKLTKISNDIVYLIDCCPLLYIYIWHRCRTGATSVNRPIMLVRAFVILITITRIVYTFVYILHMDDIINYKTVSSSWSSWWRTPSNLGWSTAAEFHRGDGYKFTITKTPTRIS